jgi:DNA-binding IclR family transcriptional regulator
MKSKGWIEDDANGTFRPGLRILSLARVVRRQLTMGQVALPVMQELSRVTNETILLTVISGPHAVCIERVDGPQAVRATLERGAVLPLHAGASATVLLAYADEALQSAVAGGSLRRFTEHTVTDPAELRRMLEQIRTAGFAFSDGEVDLGVRAVAVPVLTRGRGLVAALSLVAPAGRLPDSDISRIATLMNESARQLRDLAELRV